jgi:hypothetical protein
MSDATKLFVCYIPGLDRRRVGPEHTPYVHGLLADYPSCHLRTIPSTELTPTLLTGVGPDKNLIWQVSLKDDAPLSPVGRLLNLLPDGVTTTAQCFMHLINSHCDLSAVPWRRRRQFNQHRMKYTRRETDPDCLNEIGGYSSILKELGHDEAGYVFCKHFADMEHSLSVFPRAGKRLDFVEFYGFDLYSHWHLDNPDKIAEKLRYVDGFVKRLHARCRDAGVTMLLLVDHGQELIHSSVNIKKLLKHSGVPRGEYVYFCEVSAVRFWFKTERARTAITRLLKGIDHTTLQTYRQMHEHGICFDDPRFGELYLFADHGHTFFPHDFYNPLANFYLGLTDRLLRPRLLNARHRGNHGHLPDHPAEEGYLVICEQGYGVADDPMRVTDFAPTVMSLLGKQPAGHMTGRCVFNPTGRTDAVAAAGA